MLYVKTFVFNPLSENTYVVYDQTLQAVVIDPGCYERSEKDELDNFIKTEKLIITYLLNTHCHIDHVLGNYHIKEKYKVPFLMHKKDEPVLKAVTAGNKIKGKRTGHGVLNHRKSAGHHRAKPIRH